MPKHCILAAWQPRRSRAVRAASGVATATDRGDGALKHVRAGRGGGAVLLVCSDSTSRMHASRGKRSSRACAAVHRHALGRDSCKAIRAKPGCGCGPGAAATAVKQCCQRGPVVRRLGQDLDMRFRPPLAPSAWQKPAPAASQRVCGPSGAGCTRPLRAAVLAGSTRARRRRSGHTYTRQCRQT